MLQDTHTIIKKLISVGFTEEQAETIVESNKDDIKHLLEKLATKADLSMGISAVKVEIGNVKTDVGLLREQVKDLKWYLVISMGLMTLILSVVTYIK
jgi:hypothetical protein